HLCRKGRYVLRDILKPSGSKRSKTQVDFAEHMPEHQVREHELARNAKLLQPGSNVNLVAEEAPVLGNHVAHVEAHAISDLLLWGEAGIKRFDRALTLGGTPDCLYGAREFRHPGISSDAE